MRFIATADLQLGMTRVWLGGNQAVFDRARLDTLTTIAGLVRAHDASAVVVAGDLFEHEKVDAGLLASTLEAIGEIPAPVLVLPGNHDNYGPASVYRTAAFAQDRPENLTVLLDEPIAIDGVEFVGAPLMTKAPDGPVLHATLERLAPDGAPRVVVGHGAVQQIVGAHADKYAFDRDVLEAAVGDGRASLIVLGDRHSMLSVSTTQRIWYPGAPEPTAFGDDEGHVLLVDVPLDGGVPAVTAHVTGTWRFQELRAVLSDADDVDALLKEIAAIPRKGSVNLKVRASGVVPLDARQALEKGLDHAAKVFGSVQRRLDDLGVLLTPDQLAALPVPPYVRQVLADVSAAVEADPDDAAAKAERDLLLALLSKVSA